MAKYRTIVADHARSSVVKMTPYLDDGDLQLYAGDVIDVLRSLPPGIAQTCVTSPPYWGLRDYGTGDGQIGLEASPDLYVERMVAVFREVWRVLRGDGTVWLNLGDSYATVTGEGGFFRNGRNDGRKFYPTEEPRGRMERKSTLAPGLKPKDLVGIPWRVAFALQTDGWYLRSDIIWAKPNPMPESVSDRPTKAHEYLFLLSKRPRYFYDADAIREPLSDTDGGFQRGIVPKGYNVAERADGGILKGDRYPAAGRNRRSVWQVATEPFPEAHFATYPQSLVQPCILAGTSEYGGCAECGAPWVRQVERESWQERSNWSGENRGNGVASGGGHVGRHGAFTSRSETTGWRPTCSCHGLLKPYDPNPPTRPQTVLDPFIGSGTTALVARRLGRRCIGIDLSAEYLEIAARRTQQLGLLGGAA